MNSLSRPEVPSGTAGLIEALRREIASQRLRFVSPGEGSGEPPVSFGGLPEGCPDVFWVLALPALRLDYASPAAERLFGRPTRELLGGPEQWGSLIHPGDYERLIAGVGAVFTRGQMELECRIVRPDGDLRWVRMRMWVCTRPDGQVERLEGITADITDLKAGEGLPASGQNLRALIDHAADALFIYGADRRILDVNQQACASLGYSRDELLSRTMGELEVGVSPQELADLGLHLSRGESVTLRGRHRRKDGSEFPVEVRIGSLKEAGGDLRIAVARDITQQVRADERRSVFLHLGQRLNAAASPEAAARIVLEVADELFGWDACRLDLLDPDTAEGRNIVAVDRTGESASVAPATPLAPGSPGYRALEGGPLLLPPGSPAGLGAYTPPLAWTMAVPIRHGAEPVGALSVQSRASEVFTAEDLEVLQALADYCAGALERTRGEAMREQLEMQLRQAQKMDAVGRLAGGIAHDFNNMLAVINGYCTLMLETGELSETLRERIVQVSKAGERAAGLTRQLLAFSRNQAVKPQPIQLAETVTQLRRMLSRLLGEDLALEVDTDATPGPIWADPGQIEQVILNLVLNARDAMPQGGTLRITVAEHDLTTPTMTLLGPMAAGRYVALSVSDTGIGIAPEVLPSIFEPFFTTKPQGQGTGLGLSTVYGILKRCDGCLDVRSRMGEGTLFILYFPRRWEPEAPSAPALEPRIELGRGERVLLVEDERLVRILARTILVEAGYQVVDIGDPTEALDRYGQGHCPFDLLITDVVMPGLSGVDLALHLIEQKPDLGVLLMSGYTDDVILKHGVGVAEWSLLSKPFTRAELLQHTRRALGAEVRS